MLSLYLFSYTITKDDRPAQPHLATARRFAFLFSQKKIKEQRGCRFFALFFVRYLYIFCRYLALFFRAQL